VTRHLDPCRGRGDLLCLRGVSPRRLTVDEVGDALLAQTAIGTAGRGREANAGGDPADEARPSATVAHTGALFAQSACVSHISLSAPKIGTAGRNSHRLIAIFGGPANSESPVALRPPLTGGLPFRPGATMTVSPAQVKRLAAPEGSSTNWQPGCHPNRGVRAGCSGDLTEVIRSAQDPPEGVDAVKSRLPMQELIGTLSTEAAVRGTRGERPPVPQRHPADGASPPATVTDAISLAVLLFDDTAWPHLLPAFAAGLPATILYPISRSL
jgi:hypothetical protein